MTDTIRTEARLDDEQRALLAWSGAQTGDEALDRLRDHIKLVAASLRLALRREAEARQMLQCWRDNFGNIALQAETGPCLARDTERWLAL